MSIRTLLAVAAALGCFSAQAEGNKAHIAVDCGAKINEATPFLFGTCLEDLNHEVYGGLYGQLIFGERFEETPDDTFPQEVSIVRGKWRTLPGFTECEVSSERAMLQLKEDGWRECTVSCDVRNGEPKIYLNADFSADGWIRSAYGFSLQGRSIVVWKVENGREAEIARKDNLPALPEWNNIAVSVSGKGGLSAALNGRQVLAQAEAKPLAGNKVAMVVGGRGPVRNFAVSEGSRAVRVPFAGTSSTKVAGCWRGIAQDGGAFDRIEGKEKTLQVLKGAGDKSIAQVLNNGVFGKIQLDNAKTYQGFVVMKSALQGGIVTVGLGGDFEEAVLASGTSPDAEMKKYTFTLKSKKADAGKVESNFFIKLSGRGEAQLAQAYLHCTEGWRGANVRGDIADKMVESGIALARYGGSMVNNDAYRFKSMRGAPETRPNFHGFWYRHATLGFGEVEFAAFCKAAGFEPVIAFHAYETPEDAADMVEYFNGPADSKMGAIRAADGHPAPYGVKYFEIGNEEMINGNSTENDFNRYIVQAVILQKAMKAKDPGIKLICAVWWQDSRLPLLKKSYLALDGICDYWDIHVSADSPNSGKDVEGFISRIRTCFSEWKKDGTMKIIILEENGATSNLGRALGHAGILSAVRKNMDFCIGTCPANALQASRHNYNGWNQGQIFFNEKSAWGMPPFYAQQMNARNFLPRVVRAGSESGLILSAATDEANSALALYLTNPADQPIQADLSIANFKGSLSSAKVYELSGNLADTNTDEDQNRVTEKESSVNFSGAPTLTLKPFSHTIVRFGK